MPSPHSPSTLTVAFDDTHAVANAGLILTATLAERLGIEQLVDQLVDLGDRPGAHRPGRKLLTLAQAMTAGADCIDDADVLRTGATSQLLGHRVMAPSTLGTFLRAFTFGHIRQLDRVAETLLTRAWATGAGPGDQPITIDVDSTVCEVHGHAKGGAAYGYTKVLGYHPLLATRADTGEVRHLRMRNGAANTARGAERFINETAGRIRRAGASGPLTLRADSGFWSAKVLAACRRHRLRYSITVRHTAPVTAAIAAIDEAAWTDIAYPDGGLAQVAETTLPGKAGGRLIVRRTRLVGAQATLWPDWRHHALVTDRPGSPVELDADHRGHATVELAIRDLKQGAGLRHCPSGVFLANAAWAVIATLAHNLLRWVAALGLSVRGELVVAKTIRRRLLSLPGRLTRSARRRWLHLPAGWPWAQTFTRALARLRKLPLLA
jgi:Transposase DDE domain group 1